MIAWIDRGRRLKTRCIAARINIRARCWGTEVISMLVRPQLLLMLLLLLLLLMLLLLVSLLLKAAVKKRWGQR